MKDGKWYLRFKDEAGRWRGRVSAARTKAEAKRLQAELERRAERVRLGVEVALPDDGGGTLAALLEWWLDTYSKPMAGHETNRTTIRKHFLGSELATFSLAAVTSGRIEAFLQAKTTELAPQTINHLRSYLSRPFNAARRAGRWPGPNPAQDVKKRKVPRRQPDYLRPHEVPLLLRALDPRWRPIFAAALYTGLRKGEMLALRKADVDLVRQVLTVARSHERDTTKGGHADVIPIATELVPFLSVAIAASPSDLVFPKADGTRMRADVNLEWTLRRALGRAGAVEGYRHVCRRHGCGHVEPAQDQAQRRCPTDGRKLWVKPVVRPIRFHDLRHSTASLLMMNGANPASVQRILRHSDPKLTTEVYGHLSPEYLRAEVDRLAFGPAVTQFATPLLRPPAGEKRKAGTQGDQATGFRPSNLERETGFEPATLSLGNGPAEGPGVSTGSQGLGNAGGGEGGGVQPSQPVQAAVRAVATPLLPAADERNQTERMLTVQEAALALRVSTATVYKLCASGKLTHVRALNVIRVPERALDALRRR